MHTTKYVIYVLRPGIKTHEVLGHASEDSKVLCRFASAAAVKAGEQLDVPTQAILNWRGQGLRVVSVAPFSMRDRQTGRVGNERALVVETEWVE